MGLRQHPGQQWIACDDRDGRGSRATPFRYGREARRILGRLHGAWKLLPAVRRHSPPYNEFAPARDDKGNAYSMVGYERIGTSALLYVKFAPAPPPDATLTVTLDRIFVSTDRTWRASLFLP